MLRTLLLLLLGSTRLLAQGPIIEYGSAAELKGIKSIYIYTGTAVGVQQNIAKTISKTLPQLQILDKPEGADVVLLFSSGSANYLASVYNHSTTIGGTTTGGSTPIYGSVAFGTGSVIKTIGPDRLRVLVQFHESASTRFERRPSTNIARDFVKAYRQANDKKACRVVQKWSAGLGRAIMVDVPCFSGTDPRASIRP